MEKLANVHPGEVLFYEFLEPLKITPYRLSMDLKIPQTRISEIIKGNRRITADTALRLSKYFGNSAKFWLGLQDDFDIEKEKQAKEEELEAIRKYIDKKIAGKEIMSHYNKFTLSNGLRVLVHEDHTTPMAVMDVLYDVG